MQVEHFAALAAARFGQALLRVDGLAGGDEVRHQGIEVRCAVVQHRDARMIVQIAADSGKVDLCTYPGFLEFLSRADAGAEQNGGRAVSARAQKDLTPLKRQLLCFVDYVD